MKFYHYIFSLLICMAFMSCQNEPLGEANVNTAVLNEELFNFVMSIAEEPEPTVYNCIDFNYSFTLFVFDENENYIEAVSVGDNSEFLAFLTSLPVQHSISLNYPISGTLQNGEFLEINSNEELRQALLDCTREEFKWRCDTTLKACLWEVIPFEGSPNDFIGAVYKINPNGTVQFHIENNVFFGTWVTVYIGEELYLNIDLNDHKEIESFWDANWLIELRSDAEMIIEKDNEKVRIKKNCSISCNENTFSVCELEDNPGVADFSLQKFSPCISIPASHDVVSAVSYTFYETEDDATNNINPIDPELYNNTTNPQTIFTVLRYITSEEVLKQTEFTIEAINCD